MSALVMLTSGGTGGHMFPAEALAGALISRGYRVSLITDTRGRGFGERLPDVEVQRISAAGLAGSGLVRRAQGILSLSLGFLQARRLVNRTKPQLVVGFGGYASVPAVLAGQRAGIPTLLHEQNAVLGRANRLLAPRARLVATSFAETKFVEKGQARLTGNPVRSAIAALGEQPYPEIGSTIRILVTGGSQGARVFARLLPAAIAQLTPALRQRLTLSQQCRPEDLEQARVAYAPLGIQVELAGFFDNMNEQLGRAHLVIARSGASTVAELAAAGRPAILIPYPHATDDHQTANAIGFCGAGAGWLMPEATVTPEIIAERLRSILAFPQGLRTRASAARQAGTREAALRLADLVGEFAPSNGVKPRKEAA